MKLGTLHTAAALAAAFATRHPNLAQPGTIDSMAAASEVGTIEAAGVRVFGGGSSKLVYVKAIEHFYVPGPTLIPVDDFVQVTEDASKELIRLGRAVLATDAEVAAANKVVS